jgi:biopolymer transport protein ExbD
LLKTSERALGKPSQQHGWPQCGNYSTGRIDISADDQTSHGAIVDVIDEMRLAGMSRLAIAVNRERRT